ncbi:MAG TPA: BrnT family toxin [Gammaproteobacteria bacterium]|nr:BrnT family toxin [Gammaproteobacteria bacterium]
MHTLEIDDYEWDSEKATANLQKHGVDFADAALSLEDPHALVAGDPDSAGEQRFICLAADPKGRILVTYSP